MVERNTSTSAYFFLFGRKISILRLYKYKHRWLPHFARFLHAQRVNKLNSQSVKRGNILTRIFPRLKKTTEQLLHSLWKFLFYHTEASWSALSTQCTSVKHLDSVYTVVSQNVNAILLLFAFELNTLLMATTPPVHATKHAPLDLQSRVKSWKQHCSCGKFPSSSAPALCLLKEWWYIICAHCRKNKGALNVFKQQSITSGMNSAIGDAVHHVEVLAESTTKSR